MAAEERMLHARTHALTGADGEASEKGVSPKGVLSLRASRAHSLLLPSGRGAWRNEEEARF